MSDIKLHKAPRRWPMVLISLDKFVKGLGLIIIYFILSPHWAQPLQGWVVDAQDDPHNWLVNRLLYTMKAVLGLSEKHHLVRIGVIVYAGLYLIEGVGLLFEKKWAEWMVVVGTALFLPVEIYEFCGHPHLGTAIIFVINVVIAIYLAWRMHRQAVIKRELAALGLANPVVGFPVAASAPSDPTKPAEAPPKKP